MKIIQYMCMGRKEGVCVAQEGSEELVTDETRLAVN